MNLTTMERKIFLAIVDNLRDHAEKRQRVVAEAWPGRFVINLYSNADEFIRAAEEKWFDVILTDVYMPAENDPNPHAQGDPMSGAYRITEWLIEKRATNPDYRLIQLRWISKENVVSAAKKYLTSENTSWLKPTYLGDEGSAQLSFLNDINEAAGMVSPFVAAEENAGLLKFISPAMLTVRNTALRVAPSDAAVFLTGESGTGKTAIARFIHDNSKRRQHPFEEINIAASPGELASSELFGHEKGAFTNAHSRLKGILERCNGGTVFLDEIADATFETQTKLLKAIEEKKFMRLGGAVPIHSDFRLMSATHRDLPAMIRDSQFRSDLFYRINVVPIHLPPLRDRTEEILAFAEYYLQIFSQAENRENLSFSAATTQSFLAHRWPGNLRELRNSIQRAVVMIDSNGVIEPEHLGLEVREAATHRLQTLDDEDAKLLTMLEQYDYVCAAVDRAKGEAVGNTNARINKKRADGSDLRPVLKRLYSLGKETRRTRQQPERPAARSMHVSGDDIAQF